MVYAFIFALLIVLLLTPWRLDEVERAAQATTVPEQPHIESELASDRIEAPVIRTIEPTAAMPPGDDSFPDEVVQDDWWWRTPTNSTVLGSPSVLLDGPAGPGLGTG